MTASVEIQIIAVTAAVSCSLLGVFLVLRQMSMLCDSITHTILLGIALGFLITRDLSSPFLIAGAAGVGVITVWLTQRLSNTRLLGNDSAIGVVFPLLFSVAIILITKYTGNVHLDTDSVLLGELAFAPFDRMIVAGRDVGAKAIYITGVLLVLNLFAVSLFFKELKLSAFDPVLASIMGFTPALLHYGLMFFVSLTTVGSFQAVGSLLVVAFMIGPPSTAYLLTDDLKKMLILSGALGAASGILGYNAAAITDTSIAGAMAVSAGVIFALVFILAPKRGLITVIRRRRKQRTEFAKASVLFHILNHEGTETETNETAEGSIRLHFRWDSEYAQWIISILLSEGSVVMENGLLKLTKNGRKKSEMLYHNIFEAGQ